MQRVCLMRVVREGIAPILEMNNILKYIEFIHKRPITKRGK